MKIVTSKERSERLKRNEQKWSRTLMDAGWTVLPSVILERQQALGLDAVDVNILLHLARHWWYKENLPHPSKLAVAQCMSIDTSTVRRRIAKMEAAGFIRRQARFSKTSGRQETNFYDFKGLIDIATPYAKESLQERDRRRAENLARQRRKKPRLALVGTVPATTAPRGSDDD